MAIYKEDFVDIELTSGSIYRSFLTRTIGEGDALANRFGVRAFRNGAAETLGGNCTGYFIRNDGGTVTITGTVSGNTAYVDLPEACYAVEGQFALAIKVSGSGVTGTLRIVDGVVSNTTTGTIIDPGTIIPSIEDLMDAIDEAVASIPADYSNLWGTIAPAFDSTESYVVGQFCTYDGNMYMFIKAHSGSWNESDVVLTNIGYRLGMSVRAINIPITNENKEDICDGDIDNVQNNTYFCVAGGTTLSHSPFNTYYGLLTIGKYTERTAGDFQLATRASDGLTTIRTYYNAENGWSSWKPIPNGNVTFVGANDNITTDNKEIICGGDADGIPNNIFYGVAGNAALLHEPVTNAYYTIATFGKYKTRSAGDMQIATQASNGRIWARTYYNDDNGWNAWSEILLSNNGLIFKGGVVSITDDNKQAICGSDCNGIPNNTYYGVGGTTVLAHAPISGSYYTIATFGKYVDRTAGDLQIASDTYNGKLLYRNYINGTLGWTLWKTVPDSFTDEETYSGIGMFQRFGVIGDSFASGPILPGTADPLNQNFSLSWGQILARETGVTCVNYSEGGCGTYRFLDTTHRDYGTHLMGKVLSDISGGNKCGLYLLCLGINDSASWREFGDKHGGLEYLGSSADINTSDYTQNANSFWGNYGKIIAQLKALTPNSRLVMCTYWRENNSEQYAYSEYIQAIQEIAAYFDLPCITLTDDRFFQSNFYINNLVSNHPTASQYVGYAKAIERLLSRCIVSNYNYFKGYTALP